MPLRAMYGRRPRCKRNLTFSETFGCSHVSGLFSRGGLPPCDAAAMAAGPDVIRWSGPKQKHALNYRVAHHGFSRSTVSTVRINVVITPAVRERTDANLIWSRQTPYAAAVSAGAR